MITGHGSTKYIIKWQIIYKTKKRHICLRYLFWTKLKLFQVGDDFLFENNMVLGFISIGLYGIGDKSNKSKAKIHKLDRRVIDSVFKFSVKYISFVSNN